MYLEFLRGQVAEAFRARVQKQHETKWKEQEMEEKKQQQTHTMSRHLFKVKLWL